MDSLAANPSGGSGIYGSNRTVQPNGQDALNLLFQLKDRENRDFRDKANFMSDLSLKQDRMRNLFDPEKQNTPPMNTVIAKDPNQMTGYEKGELDIKKQGVGLEKQKLAQQGKQGQSALDIKQQTADLAQQKNDQINETKNADMQRKIADADKKLQLAQQALEQKGNNAEAALQAHKDLAAAMEERHKLEIAQKDAQFKTTSDQHQQTIDALNERLKQGKNSKTTTEINPEGTKKTVTTQKGNMIQVSGPKTPKNPNGIYTIPEDKEDDWNRNHKDQPDQIKQDEEE